MSILHLNSINDNLSLPDYVLEPYPILPPITRDIHHVVFIASPKLGPFKNPFIHIKVKI